MTLLVISPDYASHAVPLIALATAWQRRGERVIVATGPAVADLVAEAGLERIELMMSRGSNAGIIRSGATSTDGSTSLDAFFAATRRGMLETLTYQAEARASDLLWHPRSVAMRTIRIVERVRPDVVLIDHLAFAPAIGLRALGIPYANVVLGHPTALPVGAEVYGVPSAWPAMFAVDPVELTTLRAIARGVSEAFTYAFNRVLHSISPRGAFVDDAFAAHGDVVLYNYPAELHPPSRTVLLPRHVFLGSAARRETVDDEVAAWLERSAGRPLVVVSFGTFLSARRDVLLRVAAALRRVEARVAIAVGDDDPETLGAIPPDWLLRARLPQVALLRHAALLVTHGGNNSITEALTHGVPQLVMPFSTDQFDGAAAIEQNLAGLALDPNRASRPLIAGTIRGLLESPPLLPREVAASLTAAPGPEIAFAAMALVRETHAPVT